MIVQRGLRGKLNAIVLEMHYQALWSGSRFIDCMGGGGLKLKIRWCRKLKALVGMPASGGRLHTFADTHTHSDTLTHMNNFIYAQLSFCGEAQCLRRWCLECLCYAHSVQTHKSPECKQSGDNEIKASVTLGSCYSLVSFTPTKLFYSNA